jgi:lipoprotein-releasing system ATP-binding protein
MKASNLKKSFLDPKPLEVLSDVSLEVAPGESVAICGRSGEGKTTLLHILGALEKSDSGTLSINGTIVTDQNSCLIRRKCIGFIFQAFNLLEDFSVLDNILMPAKIDRQETQERSMAYLRALENLELVDLADRKETPVRLLSGGERQRVAIARAFANDPAIILADEPTGNLDHVNAARIGDLLMHCANAKKKSLIIATHDPSLASLCQRNYLLQDGHLRANCKIACP